MAGSQWERILAAEWLVVFSTETFDALSGAGNGKFSLPDPSRYFATMVVFLMLSAAAMFGDKAGKLAAAMGGVAGLTILMAPGKNGKSPVVGALAYFDKMMGGGPSGPINPATGLPWPQGTPATNSSGINQYGGTATNAQGLPGGYGPFLPGSPVYSTQGG